MPSKQIKLKSSLHLTFLLQFPIRGLFGNFHAGTTYKVKSEAKHGKKHKNGEFATVTIDNGESSEGTGSMFLTAKSIPGPRPDLIDDHGLLPLGSR